MKVSRVFAASAIQKPEINQGTRAGRQAGDFDLTHKPFQHKTFQHKPFQNAFESAGWRNPLAVIPGDRIAERRGAGQKDLHNQHEFADLNFTAGRFYNEVINTAG